MSASMTENQLYQLTVKAGEHFEAIDERLSRVDFITSKVCPDHLSLMDDNIILLSLMTWQQVMDMLWLSKRFKS